MNRNEKQTTALSLEVCVPKRKRGMMGEAWRLALAKRKEKNGEIVFDLIMGVFSALFAMTHAAFGVYPFSLALLFASSARLFAVLLGGIVGCTFLGDAGVLYLTLHIFAFVYRVLVSSLAARRGREGVTLFGEAPVLRVFGAMLLGVFMALYELILFGVEKYTLLFAAGATFLLPIVTLCFSFFTAQGYTFRVMLGKEAPPSRRYFGRHAPFLLSIGGVFLLFVAALSLHPYYFFGISLSGCATAAFSLLISRRFGAAKGCVAGLLIGLSGDPLFLPSFGLLGLLSGFYGGIGMPLSLAAAVLSGGGYAAYVGGLSGFLSVVPEMAVTALLLSVPLKLLPPHGTPDMQKNEGKAIPKRIERTEPESLSCLSGALGTVSAELRAVAEREKTASPEEYEGICVSAKEKICRRCPAEGGCSENEAVWESLRGAVIRLSIGEGVTAGANVPCEGYTKMLDEIRKEAAKLGQRKRQGGTKSTLATDYALLAEMLSEAALARSASATRDKAAEDALVSALGEYGILAEEISVVGGRQRTVALRGLHGADGKSVECEWVEEACVRILGKSIAGLRYSYEDGLLCACAASRRIYRVSGGVYTAAGKEGECAADAAVTLENENGFAYALLCDGMGSGERAARMASLGVSFLGALLSADVGRQIALALLNNAICASEEECSVALDLLSLDLYEGRAGFLKSGAAASFVYREGALFRIRSRTIPLGLLRIVDSEEATFEVREGDLLVLLSDGVLGENEDGSRLKEILAFGGDSASVARQIVEDSLARGVSTDDKTAVVLRVFSA